jgi:menaquinone-dependent protoporphyrinogen oxidase
MGNVLVVFATHYGQTRAIATYLAQCLRESGNTVDQYDITDKPPAPDAYDAVVLGSRIELGHHAPALLDYIARHREALEARPTGFFSVSMAAVPRDDPSGYMTTMFDEVGWHPSEAVALGGALPYRHYGPILRFVMKRISKSAGHTTDTSRDHVFTDYAQVKAFADSMAWWLEQHTRAAAGVRARPDVAHGVAGRT